MGWKVSGGHGQYNTRSPALLRAVLNAMHSDGWPGGAQRWGLTEVTTLEALPLPSCTFRAGGAGLDGLNSVCHRPALLETLGPLGVPARHCVGSNLVNKMK